MLRKTAALPAHSLQLPRHATLLITVFPKPRVIPAPKRRAALDAFSLCKLYLVSDYRRHIQWHPVVATLPPSAALVSIGEGNDRDQEQPGDHPDRNTDQRFPVSGVVALILELVQYAWV
jgi:hypothetical protein